jgi:hypothetical protein
MSRDVKRQFTPTRLPLAQIFLIPALLLLSCAGETSTGKRTPVPGRSNVLVGPTEVCMPHDVWLLLREANRTCAVRIKQVWLDGEATHAQIETASLVDGRWRRKTIEVAEYPLVGPHPFSFQRGNIKIACDSFTLEYSRPTCISLYRSGQYGVGDRIAAAPSAWTNLDNVDPREPRLKWYTVDDNRAEEVDVTRLVGARPAQ